MQALLALAPLGLGACGSGPEPPPLVLLISIDTLRADALSSTGLGGETSPNIDALGAEGVRFERAYSQAPNTATSHASLFTGLLPWTHRAANFTSLEYGTPGLPPSFETLAEILLEAGYETAAFTDDGPLGRGWNLMQGFELLAAEHQPIDAKVDSVLEFLDGRESGRPLFLFLHTYEVHQPYAAPEEYARAWKGDYDGPLVERVAEVQALRAAGERPNDGLMLLRGLKLTEADVAYLKAQYLAELAFTDAELGRLFDALRARSLWEPGLIAVTSDHGEEFREHGVLGHEQLYEETLHVPLLLKLPGSELAGTTVGARVNQFDLHPTLLELLRLPRPSDLEARSLVPELRDGAWTDRPSFAETTEPLYEPLTDRPLLRSLRDAGRSLISHVDDGGRAEPRHQLFRLAEDPTEQRPLEGAALAEDRLESSAAGTLAQRIETRQKESLARRARLLGSAETVFLRDSDEDTLRTLEQLGYLDPQDRSQE